MVAPSTFHLEEMVLRGYSKGLTFVVLVDIHFHAFFGNSNALQDAGGWKSPVMPLRYAASAKIANAGVKLD